MTNFNRQVNSETANNTNFADYNRFNRKSKSGFPKFLPKKVSVFSAWVFVLTFWAFGVSLRLAAEEPLPAGFDAVSWQTDYAAAKQKAKEQAANLLIYFYAKTDSPTLLNSTEERFIKVGNNDSVRQVAYVTPQLQKPLPIAAACQEFEQRSLANMTITNDLNRYVLLKLPIDAKIKIKDTEIKSETAVNNPNHSSNPNDTEKEIPVLDLPMFQAMCHLPGLAVIDYEHNTETFYEDIVGILPFIRGKSPTPEQVQTFLTLPPGTLTQRTLIYALRIHPEKPLSTIGTFQPYLTKEATDHSVYQAKTGVLGHQNFGARSVRVVQELGEGSASEICAQSWSDESLYEAAIGCVRAWRSSSGHWNIARKKHAYYGYDMVLGRNGVWYATGLFVD
jgi:hypothetical protein